MKNVMEIDHLSKRFEDVQAVGTILIAFGLYVFMNILAERRHRYVHRQP